jgi:uncharacterized membrane protein
MWTSLCVKLHKIVTFQAFLFHRLSAMRAKGQIVDVLLGTVRAYKKLPTRS